MSPTRRELVRATRARIIEAAARLTRERGPNGFSMDILAREAGVARATVYEHFRSKGSVLDELATYTAKTVSLDGQRSTTTDPLLALRDMLGDVCRHWAGSDKLPCKRRLAVVVAGDCQAHAGTFAANMGRSLQQ